jgi:hypothetical protein
VLEAWLRPAVAAPWWLVLTSQRHHAAVNNIKNDNAAKAPRNKQAASSRDCAG